MRQVKGLIETLANNFLFLNICKFFSCANVSILLLQNQKGKAMSTKKVDDFLEELDHPLKKEMGALREAIMKAHPAITEELKWGGPSFFYKGDIATFSPRVKDAAVLVFHHADGLTGGTVLEPAPKGKAYAKFRSMAEVAAKSKELQAIIAQWIELMDKT